MKDAMCYQFSLPHKVGRMCTFCTWEWKRALYLSSASSPGTITQGMICHDEEMFGLLEAKQSIGRSISWILSWTGVVVGRYDSAYYIKWNLQVAFISCTGNVSVEFDLKKSNWISRNAPTESAVFMTHTVISGFPSTVQCIFSDVDRWEPY